MGFHLNPGILEEWNDGMLGFSMILPDLYFLSSRILSVARKFKPHFSNIPVFQHSNWSVKPNLTLKK